MSFFAPSWVPRLQSTPPDSIPVCDFMLDEEHGRSPLKLSRPPFTCGLTGKEYSASEVKQRVDFLARGLAQELGWSPNHGTEWDKVVGVFSLNTIDTITLAWATHRLGGIQTPANAAYSAAELQHQLKDAGAKCLFTCLPLLDTSLKAAKKCGIPKERIYLLDLPEATTAGLASPPKHKTADDLIRQGRSLQPLERLKWNKGDGGRRTAFLCYSSGTSGLPKGVMISHRNVIANTLQLTTYDRLGRQDAMKVGNRSDCRETTLGLLPMSHIYGLVVICHVGIYRGDRVVVLPKFEFQPYLSAIQRFKINTLYLVPPIIILMTKNQPLVDKFDLTSVREIFSAAAPLGAETAADLQQVYPQWLIRQGYGLTETSPVVSSTSTLDIWLGSCGSLLPDTEARLITPDGKEITGYDQAGELLVKSPSVVLGYLNNEKANQETFGRDGFMRTGDEAVFRKAPSGNDHLFIVDRIKELIKVKGFQVAPAELEALLLTHPAVDDCAVIPVPDDMAGEVPKAFVVKSTSVQAKDSDQVLAREICAYVEQNKARHKWLQGGLEFIDAIPKSASGKILRRLLRDKERELRRQRGAKI